MTAANESVLLSVPRKRFWPSELILGLLPLILSAQALFFSAFLIPALHGVADFRQLYTGGYMIRTGNSKQLYDYDAQKRYEAKLVPVEADFTLPINHLAFEELLYAPLSIFPYRTAYWIFFVINALLLIVCLWLLQSRMRILSEKWEWFPVFLFAAFYPIMRTFTDGQDSLVMLALFAGALWCLDRNRDLTAGLLIGLGIFKFQIVLPVALLFFIWRRWRFVAGFVASSSIAGMISLGLVGLSGARAYVNTMIAMSVHLISDADIVKYATMPSAMFNLRGLAYGTLRDTLPPIGVQAITAVLSIAVIWAAAKQRPSLSLAVTAASLVSYHFLPHDASILIIPIVLALSSSCISAGSVAVILFLAPMLEALSMIMMRGFGFFVAIPLLALFILTIRFRDQIEPDVSH
jgi:hypothetical protein